MLELLLPDPAQVSCIDISILADKREIELQLIANRAWSVCPVCQTETDKVHSRYERRLADLPWADVAISICLRVRRFFCLDADCPRTIFCERLPGVVEPWARRTGRLAMAQRAIGIALGGAAGARLSAILFMKAGIDLLLNLVRRMAKPTGQTPRVLGVDDWAIRKGQTYGTILVDLERSHIVDLLPDRTADSLFQWLKERPGIEIVSRDRSLTYADAISRAAPDAIQVADRWHLLKNLSDALFKILQEEYGAIRKQLRKADQENSGELNQAKANISTAQEHSGRMTPAEKRLKERMELSQQLHRLGWTHKDIARHLNMNRKTVSRYLRSNSARAWRHRKCSYLLDPFKPFLVKRWSEGCRNAAQLYREILQQGYAGGSTTVRGYIRQLRRVDDLSSNSRHQQGQVLITAPTRRSPTPRSLIWYICKRPNERSEKDEKLLTQICDGHSRLSEAVELTRRFGSIVREKKVEEFDNWLAVAGNSPDRIWRNFAASLKQDYDAVHSALLFHWSNGSTEGHINRLKCVKRQMYGRANLDLLQQRLIAT